MAKRKREPRRRSNKAAYGGGGADPSPNPASNDPCDNFLAAGVTASDEPHRWVPKDETHLHARMASRKALDEIPGDPMR